MTNKFRAADNLFTLLCLDDVIVHTVSAIADGTGIDSIINFLCELQSNLNQARNTDNLVVESCALSMVCSTIGTLQHLHEILLTIFSCRSYMYITVEIRKTNLL
jgi:hypothetical protein